MSLPKLMANFETSLASKISSTATTLTLAIGVDDDGNALSGSYILTIDEGTNNEEHLLVALTGASGTITTRGLSRVDMTTSKTANKFEHDRGASVKVTNAPLILIQRLLNGTDSFDSIDLDGINSIDGLATPTSGETEKAANVAYVNAVAVAGGADATTTTKGISKMSVAPASATSPIAVGDNDPRVPTQDEKDAMTNANSPASDNAFLVESDTTTTPSANAVPRANSNGDLDTGWIPDGGLSIAYYTAGEAIDASSTPIAVYASSDGKVYKTDSGAVTTTFTFIGFAQSGQSVSTDESILVQTSGLVYNFTGLTAQAPYYISTSGAISSTQGTVKYQVARAINSTSLMIEKGKKILVQSLSWAQQTTAYTGTTTVNTSFYPRKITIYGCGGIAQVSNAGIRANQYGANVQSGQWVGGTTYGMVVDVSGSSSSYNSTTDGSYVLTFKNGSAYIRLSVTSASNTSVSIYKESTAPGSTDWTLFSGYVVIEN